MAGAEAFEPALKAVRKAGKVIHIGESTKQASFQFSLIEKKNLTVQGSFSHNWPVWEEAIALVKNGDVDLSSLCRARVRAGLSRARPVHAAPSPVAPP